MKVKNILFRTTLKGNGIVNYDSTNQREVYSGTNLFHKMKAGEANRNNNISYAKKKFYKNDDKLDYKLSISSNCLRHDLFIDDVQFQNPSILNNDVMLYSYIASPTSIVRGYVFASTKETLKRKGALTITDAEQTCGAVSTIEVFSRSGEKEKSTGSDTDVTDSTFYFKETIGDITYKAVGNIDLMQLQFVSCSQIFDRYGFNPDMFFLYKQLMKSKMPTFDSELGYYQINNSIIQLPEYGFVFKNEEVVSLVKNLFERLLKLNIKRKGGYAMTEKVEYKLVYDVIEDTFNNEDGWVEIKNMDDINKISFEPETYYNHIDTKLAEQTLTDLEAEIEARKQTVKAEKKAKAEVAAAKKAEEAEKKAKAAAKKSNIDNA